MSDYNNRKYRRKRRSRNEKIGFYTALSICLIAICMAVYSTYNTLSNSDVSILQQNATEAKPVNEVVTGVQETIEVPTLNFEIPTVLPDETTVEETVAPSTADNSMTALQTMLSTELTLTYPLKSNNVIREYNEKSVYFKTLNVWKPHKAVDFAGELGDEVCSMSNGAVTKVYEDAMYGKTVEISINDAVCIYSGLGSVNVKEGDSVEAGAKIGVIGTAPFEATDENHIHVQVKINGKYSDPLSFIGNNE
ncbi:MAG: M23 family metallopeptidase [Ruminococcus sp.]|nr:M23 family metallopeptidase [Ruminococcus sp.]